MTTTDATEETEVILEVTPRALDKVLEIRSAEPEADTLGLRIEITGAVGVDFQYDLALDPIDEAQPGDSVVRQGELTVIIPAASIDKLRGATLDLPANSAQGGLVIRNPNRPNPLADLDLELDGSIADKVQVLLEQSINPSLAAHGGYATLVGVREESSDVYLTMGGGCHGCAMSRMTLTNGIRQAIKEAVPEVNDVIDVTDHTQGENPFFT